jgi:hypothetical protein
MLAQKHHNSWSNNLQVSNVHDSHCFLIFFLSEKTHSLSEIPLYDRFNIKFRSHIIRISDQRIIHYCNKHYGFSSLEDNVVKLNFISSIRVEFSSPLILYAISKRSSYDATCLVGHFPFGLSSLNLGII